MNGLLASTGEQQRQIGCKRHGLGGEGGLGYQGAPCFGGGRGSWASLLGDVAERDLGIRLLNYCQVLLELGFLSPPPHPPSQKKKNIGKSCSIQQTVAFGT